MKCIWRILIAVVTAGLSEVIRHKGHNKDLVCPDFPFNNYEVIACSHLSLSDVIFYQGIVMTLDEINYDNDTWTFVSNTGKTVALNGSVLVIRINK